MVESGILAADRVEPGDVIAQTRRVLQVPVPDLVLLGIEIFLRAVTHGLARRRARTAAHRSRMWPPASRPAPARIMNPGRPPYWRYSGRISGVLANRFGRMISAGFGLGQLGEDSRQLILGVPPGEIGVRLGESPLGQPPHDLGPRERLGQEDDVAMTALDLGDDPVPEREGFGVGVVNPEDLDAVVDPEQEDVAELVPEGPPVVALEIERIDVLVLLGRVLGVLDRSRPAGAGTTAGCSRT